MDISSIIVAIDLGTTKIVTIVGQKSATGYFHVIDFQEAPSQGIRFGEVENILSVVNIVKPQIASIEEKLKIAVNEVYVGIAGQHVRNTEGSTDFNRDKDDVGVSEEELMRLQSDIKWTALYPGEKILQAMIQTYSIDGEHDITEPLGRLGRKLTGHFHLVIGKINSINRTELCMSNLNLHMKELILEPIASAMAVLSEEEKEAGVAVVDMGGGTTDMVIYVDKIVKHTAVIPFGGNIITSDIKQGLEILQDQAERIKKEYGSCVHTMANPNKTFRIAGIGKREDRVASFQTLAWIIEARMCEIIDIVISHIEPYKNKLKAGIVFTGGGSQMTHLKEYVTLRTGMYVEIGRPFKVSGESPKEIIHPRFSTAIGLLMCAANDVGGFIAGIKEPEEQTPIAEPAKKKPVVQAEPSRIAGTMKTGIEYLKKIFDAQDTDEV